MVSMSSLMILVLAATMCLAYPEKGRAFHVAQQQRCPSGDSLSCIDKKENDVCTAPANQYNGLACGVCSGTAPQCTLVCVANADQTGCMAEPVTCPKFTGIACGTSRVLVGGDALVQPTEMSSSNGALTVNLVARVATVNATAFSFSSRLFCLGETCRIPAPTLRVRAGDLVTITLTNSLPPEAATTRVMNQPRFPNHANVHTHGLHVDPSVDNVMETVLPGATKTYTYRIPSTHLPGTHWYHSHVHGSSALQVMGGMSGVIIVDGPSPSPSYAAMASFICHTSPCAPATPRRTRSSFVPMRCSKTWWATPSR